MNLKHDTQHNHQEHEHTEHHHTEHGFHNRHEGEGLKPEESERHHGRGGRGGHRGEGLGRGHHGMEEGRGGGRGEGRGGRARRGEARYILLEALRDGPKHGYEIIKSLEERSGGRYSPSPGTVYPTMQMLQDLGLVRADQDAERRVFSLTEAGLADLDTHTQEIADFWERFAAAPSAAQPEATFVREELENLARTIRDGLREPLQAGNTEAARAVRTALERCRNEVREILVSNPLS